jgi:hypothetical protein
MDKHIARHIAAVVHQIFGQLDDLRSFLEVNCEPGVSDTYGEALTAISRTIDVDLLGKLFLSYPELRQGIESKFAKFGEFVLP